MITFANDLPSNGAVSLQVFVIRFNIRFIKILNKPKYLSIVKNHRVISLGKFDVFQNIVLNSQRSVLKQISTE